MNKIIIVLALTFCLFNCTVKETIVFEKDGSGKFLVSYDMSEMMKQMSEQMGGASNSDEGKAKEVMDTTMVFNDIMEEYKDSIASLTDEERKSIEALKDMYMTMKMDEDKGLFNMGIGLNFKKIEDLKGIGDKIKKAQSLNKKGGQVDAMKDNSPIGKFMGDDKNDTQYMFTDRGFSRITNIDEIKEIGKIGEEEGDEQFMEYFENATYIVEYTFPKKIKSVSVEGAELSKDKKTVTYTKNWIDFINNPKALDFSVEFK